MEDALEKCAIPFAFSLLVDFVNAPRRPGMHRRIHIAKCPLISGNLPVGMHVPLAQHERELFLCEIGIDQCKRNAVKRQVPCGVPRVLPLVWHGDHIGVVEVPPIPVAPILAFGGWGRAARIALQPILDHIVIELLRPQHAGEALAHYVLGVI